MTPGSVNPFAVDSGKAGLREAALAARRALPAATRAAWDATLVAAAVSLARASASAASAGRPTVTAYRPLADEPGGAALVPALATVATVLLPVLLDDRDLDWVAWPASERLGVDAIAGADLVLVPALGASRAGVRLGRGGGSYDRALPRIGGGTPVVAILYADELHAELPAEPHDRPVTAALTPHGLVRLG